MIDQSLRRLLLLGPQPQFASLITACQRIGLTGQVAVVTAGWEEDELDRERSAGLFDAVPSGSFNLELFHRSEQLFARDPQVIQLLRERQDRLRHLRQVYCLRLDDVLDAARKTLRREDSLIDLAPERESAIEMVRQIDRQYFVRTSQVCDEYDELLDLTSRDSIRREREQVAELLGSAQAIVIGGGHAAIILNRLKIFGVLEANPALPVVAWSGGAMALADQVVLFHDSPPQGRGNPEVLRAGMSMDDRFLPLPDARQRLLLNDRLRVELFARRFDNFQCVLFDEQTIMDRCNGTWWANDNAMRLGKSGELEKLDLASPEVSA